MRTPILTIKLQTKKIKSKNDQRLIQILMGNDVAPRKEFIISRALDVSNLDI